MKAALVLVLCSIAFLGGVFTGYHYGYADGGYQLEETSKKLVDAYAQIEVLRNR